MARVWRYAVHDAPRVKSLLPGIDEAADRIVSAIADKRLITIYGDYDVDGVTGTSLLWHCLTLAGGRVEYTIPDRLNDGYGLNPGAIRTLAEAEPFQLVISVDCGIASIEEAALAEELGLELIVTDHHQYGDTLPSADVASRCQGPRCWSTRGCPEASIPSETSAGPRSPSSWPGPSASDWATDAGPRRR